MRISDWSSDVCSSDLLAGVQDGAADALRTPVIFLHAGVADGRMWQAQLDEFAPRHRVVAYDRRGFGKTRGQAETFSHIDDLLAVLDGLDIDQAALVGCSQGGRIAIDFARSEEHTSELQSLMRNSYAVLCLKKKTYTTTRTIKHKTQ